ncbi:uncharacterized protein C8A04DRAFT_14077 [Dichotomopilus funicola]|uniref:N-acetylgalactosaminide beta-1,3-galactosyltransferase n=1 Tax=Dichotomopilus funicola TaxID=1934379 RepID=A0AAN6UYC8_9PEZI|nr:hypothetical protein C8A04DRAFT_14077 [Dichotomopilus funicola]
MPGFPFPAAPAVLRYRLNRRLGRNLAIAIFFFIALFALWDSHHEKPLPPTFYPFETTSAFSPVSLDRVKSKTLEELCDTFPHHLAQRIQPVLKMGHGENPKMVDAQFGSVSACFRPDELLVFSDLDEMVQGRHAIDILANLPQAYRDPDEQGRTNQDYMNYETMAALARAKKLTPENDPAKGKNGWRLDKYKFLAGVERAWQMRPDRDFYVFYETDTYISWDNMFRFLSTLDPHAPLYMGSPSPGRHDENQNKETWFANGGPGYVLSRGAMEKLFARKSSSETGHLTEPPVSLKYLDLVRSDPCGDSVLGWALWNAGVPLSGFFPLFNTYPVHSMPYTERLWCQPFLTMHKLTPEDLIGVWRWEHGRRTLGNPLLYSDLFDYFPFATPAIPDVREDWDNTNWDRLGPGRDVYVDSVKACQKACEDSPSCLQYHYQGTQSRKCVLQQFINHGVAKKPETVEKKVPIPGTGNEKDKGAGKEKQKFNTIKHKHKYTSGWMKSRISVWVKQHSCPAPQWVFPSIERHY